MFILFKNTIYTSVEIKRFSVWSFIRSSHQRCSMKKGVLRNFIKFTGKHLCQGLFFNKVEHRIYRTPSVAASSSLMNVKGDLTKVEINEHLIKIFRGNVYLCTIVYKLKMFIPNINYAFKIHCHSGESAIRLFTKSRILIRFIVGLSPSKKICLICLKALLKKMKNAFYFILRALFVLKIFKFLSSRPLYFFKKDMRWKQVVCSLVSTYFDSPQLAIQ